jgi:hypothetical protein
MAVSLAFYRKSTIFPIILGQTEGIIKTVSLRNSGSWLLYSQAGNA